jgi:hypothetical protein
VTGADNQQERLAELRGWVIGFVDGEGCFSVSFLRQQRRQNGNGGGIGFQVFHEFVVTQGERSIGALYELREHFGVGQVIVNRRHDDHRENLHRYVVRRREDLLETIIPFFRQHPLRTAKRCDFAKFATCVELVDGGNHRTREGLLGIVQIVETINRRKPRPELVRILRDHTPDVHDNGR